MDIYFDNAATTPVLPEVREAMTQALDAYGNPSSLHGLGIASSKGMEDARSAVLGCAGRRKARVVFTGGGTEANNLAIVGTVRRYRNRGRHLVTTAIEHPSVLETFRALEADGWSVTYVMPNSDGTVPAERVLEAVREDTVLVSTIHVNNETGAIQDVERIGRSLANHPKVLYHVDGIQAFGKIPACLGNKRIDLYTVSGHKIGAPKGIGALILRDGLVIDPLLYGGGQEYGLRSGTENTLGIAALAKAAELAGQHAEESLEHVERMRTAWVAVVKEIPGAIIHQPQSASPYVLSVSFPGLRGEVMVHALEAEGVYVSTGSACSTKGGHVQASHVLHAMGCDPDEVTGTLRFSFARWNTLDEVHSAAEVLKRQIGWLMEVGGKRR